MNEIIEMIKAHEDSHIYNKLDESIKSKFLEVYPKYAETFPFDVVNFAKDMGIDVVEYGIFKGSNFSDKKQRFYDIRIASKHRKEQWCDTRVVLSVDL